MELNEADLDPDPLRQFETWFDAARAAEVRAPEAMALATATPDGTPSVRMVLLKGADERGYVFFTSYESRKGRELEANPQAALLFHWEALGRQVRVEGMVERASAEESDTYFASRPPGSRAGAAASRQSRALADRAELDRAVAALGDDVSRPDWWGGYRVRPERYEFWQHRENRLHDRFLYERDGSGWRIQRLYP
ncbi:MAG: pyridoxamine 5-phosphate oxidase [Gaiellaceae bacterium]|jgi:pyridoxamine 5'-phosphate oxidase|nr:pyridoxamine 5-phosphate oxidase [Gaiellaceae bacterium]MDX6519065.1 pyridoxamine 5-phosphate oxidase [Gaiellaceae bacterium]